MVGSTFKEAYKGLTGDSDQYSPDELAEIAAFLNGKRFGKRAIVQDGLTLADSAVAQLGNVEKMPSVRRTGKFIAEGPESVGTGILAGLIHVGARPSLVSSSVEGDCNAYSTSGASSGQTTGLRLVIPNIFRMRRNLRLKIKFSISAVNMTADPRLYIGFDSVASWPISDVPLGNSDSGVVFGKSAGDTVFKIYNNDATGAEVKGNAKGGTVDVPNDINVATDVHVLEFKSDADGLRWLYNIDAGEDMEITSRIPALDTQLYFRALVQNATSTVVVLNVYYVEAEILAEGYLNDILPWTGSGGSDRGIWKNDKIETVFNKIIPVDLNTIRDSDDVLNNPGDILVNDNVRYARFAKGTPLQYLRVKADNTGLEWATLAGTTAADVFTNQANVFGDFDNKFRSGRLKIANPANNFFYSLVASAIAANVNISLPAITSDDEIVTKNLIGQILSNKMLTSATITDILTFARQASTPAIPSVGYANLYPKQKDLTNDGFFAQIRVDGIVTEIELTASLAAGTYQALSGKNAANGYAGLDSGTKLLLAQIPVLDAAHQAATTEYNTNKNTASGYAGLDSNSRIAKAQGHSATMYYDQANPYEWQGPTIKRVGIYTPLSGNTTNSTVGRLEGIFAQHLVPSGAGTPSNPIDTTEGYLAAFVTGAVSGNGCGLIPITTSNGITRRAFRMFTRTRQKVDIVTFLRYYFGFTSASAGVPSSGSILGSADHGVMVGFIETGTGSTNWSIWHNDGSGAAVVDDITGPIAKDTAYHTIEINWAAAGNVNVVFDGITQTISSRIPAVNTNLWFHNWIQITNTTAKTLTTKGTWLEC